MLPEEEIEVSVEEEFRGAVNEGWVKKMVWQVLKAEGVSSPYEVSLVFTDSETVRELSGASQRTRAFNPKRTGFAYRPRDTSSPGLRPCRARRRQ